jgi:hypothetical protein
MLGSCVEGRDQGAQPVPRDLRTSAKLSKLDPRVVSSQQ